MYRKNVSGQYICFTLINATTGAVITGATIGSIGKYRTIDGAAQAAMTGTITETAQGQYQMALSQADVNGNNIAWLFTYTGAIAVNFNVVTTAADPTNATTFGLTNLDATVSSRSTYAGGDTSGTTTLLSRIASALTITGGKVDVNDKTGFSLSSAGVQAVWDFLLSGIAVASSIGKLLKDNIDTTISSRSTYAGGAVASVTAAVTVGTNNDKTGYALTAGEHTNVVSDVNTAFNASNGELASIPNPAAVTLRQMIQALYQYIFVKRSTTTSIETLYKVDGTTALATSTVSNDGITAIHGKIA